MLTKNLVFLSVVFVVIGIRNRTVDQLDEAKEITLNVNTNLIAFTE